MIKYILILLLIASCSTIPSSINLSQKADTIIESAEISPPDTRTIIRTADSLYNDDKYVKSLEAYVHQSEIDTAKDMSTLFKTFLLASAIMLVGGIFAMGYQQKTLGGILILSSIVLTGFTTSLIEYLPIIALVTTAIIILMLCILAYKYYNNRIALKDSILGFEIVKDSNATWHANKSMVSRIQNPMSQKIIKSIKEKEVKS